MHARGKIKMIKWKTKTKRDQTTSHSEKQNEKSLVFEIAAWNFSQDNRKW